MSYALTATKRKFHRILDDISNASTTSLLPSKSDEGTDASTTELSSSHNSLAKKRRVSPTSLRHSISEKRLPTVPQDIISGRKPTSRPATSDQTTVKLVEPPLRVLGFFAPWDQDQFLGRLRTFTHEYFRGKPAAIAEVEWAKRGWSCVGEETVGCIGGCEARVVIDLKVEYDEEESFSIEAFKARKEMEAQLVQKYADLIINAHSEDCPWHKRGCNETIQQLCLFDALTTISDIRQRYDSLVTVSHMLPDHIQVPSDYNVESVLELMPRSFLEETTSDQEGTSTTKMRDINIKAFTMSLFGWSAHDYLSEIVTCGACFRRLGLWIFRTDAPHKEPIIGRLDVVEEHRDYCPWKNVSAQNSGRYSIAGYGGVLPGYKQLVTVIENAHHLRRESIGTSAVRAEGPSASSPSQRNSAATMTPSVAAHVRGEALHERLASEEPHSTEPAGEVQAAEEEAKDKARWAKLKMLRKALHLNVGKKRAK